MCTPTTKEKKKKGNQAPECHGGSTSTMTLPCVPSHGSTQPFSVLDAVALIAFPSQFQLCLFDLKWQPLVRRAVISPLFLISRVPRDKRSYHKVLNSLETEDRLLNLLARRGVFFLMCVHVFTTQRQWAIWEN